MKGYVKNIYLLKIKHKTYFYIIKLIIYNFIWVSKLNDTHIDYIGGN